MLKLAKQRQSQKNEKFAIIPIPVQYTFKIVRTVIQYLCFGTLQIEKDISFQDFQRLVRCFEYFKLISGKSDENEVLPLLREICIQRQFTFAVTESDHQAIEAVEKKPAKLILMKQVISHVDKMHNRDYSVECASFNNKRSAAAENMWTGPRSKRHRASAIGYVDNDLMIPGKDKITSRSAKFGGQTDDNKRLLRTSMSRFAENSSYVVLGNDSNDLRSRLSSGNNNRGRNFNRARSMGPVGRRNNFSRAQSVGATHARIERRLIARKSQPRDLPGDNSNQVNPVANKPVYRPNNVYRAASRGPSRGPPNRRAQSRGPGDRARSRGPPRNSAKDSRYNDHRPSGDTHRGSRRDSRSPRRHRDSYRRRSRSPKNSIYRERRSSPGSFRRNRSRSPPKRTISNNRFNSQPRPAAQQQFGNPAPYGTKNQYQVLQNQPVQMGYYGGVPTQFVPVHVPNSQKPYGNKYGYGRR